MADKEIKKENRQVPEEHPKKGTIFKSLDFHLNLEGKFPPETIEKISKHQYIYSITGLVGGLLCILSGIILFILGISGRISWTASLLGAKSELIDAAPGGLLFIIGIFVIFITRYKIKIKK